MIHMIHKRLVFSFIYIGLTSCKVNAPPIVIIIFIRAQRMIQPLWLQCCEILLNTQSEKIHWKTHIKQDVKYSSQLKLLPLHQDWKDTLQAHDAEARLTSLCQQLIPNFEWTQGIWYIHYRNCPVEQGKWQTAGGIRIKQLTVSSKQEANGRIVSAAARFTKDWQHKYPLLWRSKSKQDREGRPFCDCEEDNGSWS